MYRELGITSLYVRRYEAAERNLKQAIALAQGLGLDPQVFLDTVRGGVVDTPYVHLKGQTMIAGEFDLSVGAMAGFTGMFAAMMMTEYGLPPIVAVVLTFIVALILAIIFVVIVGLGPFAGMLALALHSVAALGKLYSEVIEGIDPMLFGHACVGMCLQLIHSYLVEKRFTREDIINNLIRMILAMFESYLTEEGRRALELQQSP